MKPLLLISNDDSIYAKGIKELVEIAKEFGRVVVVAPDKPQSAKSHSITLDIPMTYKKSNIFGDDIEAYAVSGSPADCVKLALNYLLKQKPDLVLSGINHGANTSVNLIYSGTVAAAIEGAMHDIKAIALSLTTHNPDADFSAAKIFAKKIINETLNSNIKNICLNVNIPNIKYEEINGINICRQTRGAWFEEFDKIEKPGSKENYFWLTGKYVNFEPENTDTDVWAIENNYISVVPLEIDFTNYQVLNKFNEEKFLKN
jgi:5'-nucleotidase